MGIAGRLATEGGADNAPGIGPKRAARNDSGTKTSQSAFGTGPTDVITQENEFHTEASGRFDARGNQVQVITLDGFTGTDQFTFSVREAGGNVVETIAFVRGTNATAAAIQTELRSILAGTDLVTVAGTTDEGPFTVTFNDDEFHGRAFPRLGPVTGTGCTGVVTRSADGGVKRYLGETKYEGTTELVGPTIGTITVTPGVDEVQSFAKSAGTDEGTFELAFRRGRTGPLAWDADPAEVKAALDNAFEQVAGLSAADAPTVRWKTPLNMEIVLGTSDPFAGADTATLTYDTTHESVALVASALSAPGTAAARAALIVAWVKSIDVFANSDITAAEVVEDNEYDVTFHNGPHGLAVGDFALTTSSDDEDQTPDENTAQDEEAGYLFTFENGALAGRPVRGGLRVQDDSLGDGGVAEAGTFAVDTAGVLGSASAAYTEQATVGDSVFGEAVNDDTGKGYAAQKDAASPAVFGGLPPGDYTLVLRTVADKALSAPSTKAFAVTSA